MGREKKAKTYLQMIKIWSFDIWSPLLKCLDNFIQGAHPPLHTHTHTITHVMKFNPLTTCITSIICKWPHLTTMLHNLYVWYIFKPLTLTNGWIAAYRYYLFYMVKGHFTHEPRAVTIKVWEPKRKCPKAVSTHLQNHVLCWWILKCSVKSYVTGP